MSKVLTGIYGRPSGKTGGVVWGAGRTATGKVATTREYVIPKNPSTDLQESQRSRFTEAVGILRTIGYDLWHFDWDNGVGELPGWQSMLGWVIQQLEDIASVIHWIADPVEISLGPVYMPPVAFPGTGITKTIVITWPTDIIGDHCAATDHLRGLVSLHIHPNTPTDIHEIPPATLRSAGTVTITCLQAATSYCVCLWFRHVEDDLSLTYSPTDTQMATSHV